jgi:hypothetical protein
VEVYLNKTQRKHVSYRIRKILNHLHLKPRNNYWDSRDLQILISLLQILQYILDKTITSNSIITFCSVLLRQGLTVSSWPQTRNPSASASQVLPPHQLITPFISLLKLPLKRNVSNNGCILLIIKQTQMITIVSYQCTHNTGRKVR